MLSLRYIWRLVSAFISKFKFLLFGGVALGILAFILFARVSPLLNRGQVERIGITGRFRPDNLPTEIANLIGDGLTEIDSQGNLKPDLAESWQVDEEGKVWIFHLKKGVLWQDGKVVVSEDIKYPFSDVTLETPDENTIIFRLQNAFSPFPAVVARPVFKKGLLGTGDWEVKSRGLRLSGAYVESLTIVDASKNTKVFKFYPTEERAKLALRLGSVNKIENVFSSEPFTSWRNVEIVENIQEDQHVVLFLNTQDAVLSEKALRQALAYGIDKNAFGAPRAVSPISPNSWAFNPQVKPYTFDQAHAKELLDELPKEQRETLGIRLATTPILLDAAEKIAANWNEIGVKTEVQVTSSVPDDFQALLVIFDIPSDPDQYSLWHSTQTSSNITKFSNPRIDKLLEDGRTELDQGERKSIYLDFQRFLVEESPAIFLYHPITYTVSRK